MLSRFLHLPFAVLVSYVYHASASIKYDIELCSGASQIVTETVTILDPYKINDDIGYNTTVFTTTLNP